LTAHNLKLISQETQLYTVHFLTLQCKILLKKATLTLTKYTQFTMLQVRSSH